ncbi:MAG: hypothetical protein HKN71_11480, partial [Gemmatimonadetes bacterium]|nr:hypothetical protein [Gemmatimonadota bacterium]
MWGSGVRSGMRVQWLSVVGGAMSVSAVLAVGVAGQGPAGNSVRTVTDTLVGSVGGVAVDALGAIYVADFGERVYKVRPDGRWEVFVDGLYGTSGNAIDSRGRLIQSQFSGNSVARVDRDGTVSVVAEGLEGPVGVALGPEDEMYVCNCRSNTISRVSPDGEVTVYAESELFNCPNGIT